MKKQIDEFVNPVEIFFAVFIGLMVKTAYSGDTSVFIENNILWMTIALIICYHSRVFVHSRLVEFWQSILTHKNNFAVCDLFWSKNLVSLYVQIKALNAVVIFFGAVLIPNLFLIFMLSKPFGTFTDTQIKIRALVLGGLLFFHVALLAYRAAKQSLQKK